jgi:hypothetical protein
MELAMPRRSRPRHRHRHAPAHVRAQRARVIAARVAAHRLIAPDDPRSVAPGHHATEQWLLGCHNVGCGICATPDPGRRQRDARAWRADWEL